MISQDIPFQLGALRKHQIEPETASSKLKRGGVANINSSAASRIKKILQYSPSFSASIHTNRNMYLLQLEA
jgi:hypothetical protein